ncbi:MAG: response regulator [Deltaproteobacteria bacterium]|nr:response regulator [Deltaproteobacteria bacterium]
MLHTQAEEAWRGRDQEGCQVLVIDDDLDIRETLATVLAEEGYAVASAANGEEALGYLARAPAPRLILLDLMMPVMNGWQFCARQRELPELASIPVVIISADGNLQNHVKEIKACSFLKKPIHLNELLDIVGRFCPRS